MSDISRVRLSSSNYKKCVVCNKRRTPGSNVFLARLPLDPDRCRMWVKAIGQEDLINIPIEKLHQLKFVCNIHFKQEDFIASHTKLLEHAVPTLNLPLKPLADNLFDDFPLHIGQYPKHDILQDITNLESQILKTTPVAERKSVIVDFAAVPGCSSDEISVQSYKRKSNEAVDFVAVPGCSRDEISVQSYKRKRKSNEAIESSISLNTREEKLLQKLKAQTLTIRKLAKTSLDLDKIDNTMLKNFVSDIAKNHKKKPSGKRWRMNTKLWALAIFKRSPKAYRYLEWAMPMPSVKTLQRLLQSVPLEPGINKNLITKCKDVLSGLSNQDKFCAVLFDEMSLKKRLIYNEASDKIEGFEDHGDERSSKIADHALVFMVQGLRKKFKLPIAYYFVQGTISSQKLSVLIKNVIMALEEVGFKIVTTVCDQGPTNVGALTLLKKFCGQSPVDNYFSINEDKKIFIMFDIPHLFKSIRNNFYNAGEIVWGEKTGKWCHLVEAEEKNSQFLNFPKLTKNVDHPTYKIKMRVKYAAHALSNTMSAILQMLAWKHESAAKEIAETANIIKELDKLFDFCNGPSSPKDIKKGIRENVSRQTNHVEMWRYFLSKMDTLKFLKSDSALQLKNVWCIKGFKTSLQSLESIWNILQKEGFKYLNMRQLNQDSLENLFGTIRQHGATNSNPTCIHFTAALKTSILMGLTAPHSRGSNCEPDANTFLFNYENVQNILNEDTIITTNTESADNIPVLSLPEETEDLHIEELCSFKDQPVVYVSGYLASRFSSNLDCMDCKKSLIIENPNNDIYNYIAFREWWKEKKSLTYPSIGLCQTVNKAKTIFDNFHIKSLSAMCVLEFTVHCDFTWFTCTNHVDLIEKILKRLSLLFIRKHCKIINEKFLNVENSYKDNYKKAQIKSNV